MSIDTPNGILDITNAIVRVSKMEFQQATGFDTVLNNIARNTILLSDSATYETHSTYHNWALKLPNAWVFEADVYFQSGTPGVVAKLNFYNNVNTAITNGYTLELDGTSLVLKYDGTQISTATLSTTLNDDAWHKLFVLFERDTIAVAIDGKAEYTFTDSELRARVYNDDTGYVVFYHESGTYARKIKNLKFVNGDKWLRESGSSNIAYVGGSVGVGTDAPKHTLDVFGNANVGTLTSTGIYGEIVGSNAVGASTGTFSGDLEVGTANLFVDVSTSNVGIGTDTPLATLDVQGDFLAGVSGNLFVNSDTGSVGISNTAPVHTLDVGSNLYVQNGGDTVLYVQGNAVVSNKLTVESFRISSSSSSGLQAVTSGVGANSTTNRIEITNADNSTSTSTGALALTNGGLGVAGDIVAGGSLTLSSDLAVDTNTLKVDAANNRVGILTASPQYGLDVHGTANVGALTATSSTVSGALSGGSASISGALSAASASITGQLLVDTDTLTVDAVNDRVGVNTASPQYDLDVSGNVAVSSNLMVNTNTLFVDSVNSRVGVGTTEPSQAFEVSGNVQVGTANLFVDTVSGNVGVGTNSPTYKLQISGDTLVNTGQANWDTGMKSLMGTQDLINVGTDGIASIGSVTASTDVDLPPDVVGDVIAKFVNSHTTEVYTNMYDTGVVGVSGQDIVFNIWIYNSSGSTISSQLFVFSGQTQNVSFSIPSTSTWVKYTQTITLSAANSGNSMQLRMDNNTQGTTFYFTGLSVRVNPSNTTDAPFTPRGFPISGTGTVLSVPNIVAKEASMSTLHIDGNVTYPMVRWEVDLTSQSTSNFYPIEFTHLNSEGTPDLPDYHPIHFKIFGESLGSADSYNENTLVGYAKGGGWSDHGPMYDIHIEKHYGPENRFQGLYEGTTNYAYGIVIYMRGGYRYSAITDANEVITHTSAYTSSNSTFAIKDVNGNDVSGTSANISELVDLGASAVADQRWMSGSISSLQPCVIAYPSTSKTYSGSSNQVIKFGGTYLNRGSMYDTSTGVITIPEYGIYAFGMNAFTDSSVACIYDLMRSTNSGTNYYQVFRSELSSASGDNSMATMNVIVEASAGHLFYFRAVANLNVQFIASNSTTDYNKMTCYKLG